MVRWNFLVTILVFFLQYFPLPVPVQALKTMSLPMANTTGIKARCVETARKALLRIKHSLTDPSGRLASWDGKECCTWAGVFCDIHTGTVINLDLNDRSGNCYMKKIYGSSSSCLGGNISPALLHLQHLEYLDLGGNDFQGLATPYFLGSLDKLQYLNLSRSSLVGVPPSFGNLTNLRHLDLHADFYFQDTAESSRVKNLNWVSGLSSLRYLDLSYVDLSLATNWLEAINRLPSLVTLWLENTSLHDLPESFPYWNMTSLSHLYLTGNNFVNSVLPKWLSNATNIEAFNIRYSNIGGTISNVEWGNLCNLRVLYLTQNKIDGDISRVVEGLSSCSNTSIEALRLEANKFTGHLKNLRALGISSNLISGTVPASIEQLSRLEFLDLGETGALPDSVFKFSELTVLSLTTNAWEGNLSQNHFARLHKLKDLALHVEKISPST